MRRDTFTFLCSDEERRLIAAIAARLERSQSDAVRYVLREKARELEVSAAKAGQVPEGDKHGHQ